jgi:Terminase RNaseH-like domain
MLKNNDHVIPEFAEEENTEADQYLSQDDNDFLSQILDKLMLVAEALMPEGESLRPYQIPFVRRILESLVLNDGNKITALFSRQSGKTEAVATATATAMIMFPVLSVVFPRWFGIYRHGMKVGAFAPVDEQADNLFSRVTEKLTSAAAQVIYADPDINESTTSRGRHLYLRSGSIVRKTTCHPKATIEGRTYHLILIDESQGADEYVVNKSVFPMGSSTNATVVLTGTCNYHKGLFYHTIQYNIRENLGPGNKKQNHFHVDYKVVGKYNASYAKFVAEEKRRLGEDSDEFRLSYRIQWILEKGMFTTTDRLDELGDTSMQSVVKFYFGSPVVVGIDCGRKQDKTIVTIVWVDWDNPDPFGIYHHHVLNWLDLEGRDWEDQYFEIVDFLSNYNILKVGVDIGGLGDTVAQRLKILMPQTEIVELGSANSDQSVRWKHLNNLMEQKRISWPAGSKVRDLKRYKRFRKEMEDLEILNKGPYFLAEAPKSTNAHDDYPDSLAMACVLTIMDDSVPDEAEMFDNIFYRSR